MTRAVRKSIFPRTETQPGFRYSVLCRARLVSGYIIISLVQKKKHMVQGSYLSQSAHRINYSYISYHVGPVIQRWAQPRGASL